ncbi:MAG: hypothetical protein KBE09_00765 [Candidatus Pacebacteria bacterium]|nr:hypothetical protein [Candidatus Paceibacterota bacterium]
MSSTTKKKEQRATNEKKGARPHVVLLDAHAIIHRAYHALPEFTSSSGEPTGALYGLAAMLITIIQRLKPDYIVACTDLPEPTHRHDVYEAYKGTRAKTDDALVAQLKKAHEVFEAFHIPVFSAVGFEADDCLGTLVHQLEKEKVDITIASGDMDTLQLVSGTTVKVFTLRKGMNDTVLYDEEAVKARYGFGPELIPDYKGLRGDPSDNIKGVKGIGEKAATELVTNFGTVKNIYATLKKHKGQFEEKGIKPRVVSLLEEGEDDALFSVMLATIRTDAPISYDLPKETWRETVRLESILSLCDRFEFRTLGARAKTLLEGKEAVAAEARAIEAELTPEERIIEERTAVMAWLLASDMTNPTRDDVLRFAGCTSVRDAEKILSERLQKEGRLWEVFTSIEEPLISIAQRMQAVGVALDVSYLKTLSKEYHHELQKIEKRIFEHAGHEFNIKSPAQLSVVLFEELKLSVTRHKKTEGGKLSTKESELEKLSDQHPIIADILGYRELSKLLSTYVDSLPTLVHSDGRLHARFLQTGTTTGRMASIDPNLQNIPTRSEYGRRIRHAFVAGPGKVLVAIDYSQIELRIAAGLSGDENLVKIFADGGDVHEAVAAQVFGVEKGAVDKEMRRRAKIINFGILYGMGVNALRQNLGESVSREEAAHFLSDYFTNFSGLQNYLERTKESAARLGYTETYFGRRRNFSGFTSHLPQVRAQAERMALNAPIQGTQADIIKKAMATADTWIQSHAASDAQLLLQVHDELIYEVTEGKEQDIARHIREIMEHVLPGGLLNGVPIKAEVSIGKNWGSLARV